MLLKLQFGELFADIETFERLINQMHYELPLILAIF